METSLSHIPAVVLAGGYGTRVRHLLEGVPKPMAPVAGQPFLAWILRYLRCQGVRRAVISTGYLAETVASYCQKQPIPGISIHCVAETSPLGTGGGFLHAARASGENPAAWLVLNGDTLAFADLQAVAARLKEPCVQGVLLARRVPDAARYGTIRIGPRDELLGFSEKRPGEGIINAGVYLLRQSLLDQMPQQTNFSLENDVFPDWAARRLKLQVHQIQTPFLDIGTPETLTQAESFVQKNHHQFGLSYTLS